TNSASSPAPTEFIGQPRRPSGVYSVGEGVGRTLGREEVRDGPGRAGAPAALQGFEPRPATVTGKTLHGGLLSGDSPSACKAVPAAPSSLAGHPGWSPWGWFDGPF